MVQLLGNNDWQFLVRLNMYQPQDPAIPLIREKKAYVQPKDLYKYDQSSFLHNR